MGLARRIVVTVAQLFVHCQTLERGAEGERQEGEEEGRGQRQRAAATTGGDVRAQSLKNFSDRWGVMVPERARRKWRRDR